MSKWLAEYKQLAKLPARELEIARHRAFEMQKDLVIKTFMDGLVSPAQAQRELDVIHEQMHDHPEHFDIN